MARGKSSKNLAVSSSEKMQKLFENLNERDVQNLIEEGLKARINGTVSPDVQSIYTHETEEVPLSSEALEEIQDVMHEEKVAQTVSPKTDVILLNYKSPEYLDFLGTVLQRVIQFSIHHTPEADPYEVMKVYQTEWIRDNPNLITILAFHSGQIVGHMCAQVSQLHGALSIVITQFQLDDSVTRSTLKKALTIFENWRNKLGIESVEALAYTAEMATMHKKFFGAKAKASIYQLDLSQWVGEHLGEDLA